MLAETTPLDSSNLLDIPVLQENTQIIIIQVILRLCNKTDINHRHSVA